MSEQQPAPERTMERRMKRRFELRLPLHGWYGGENRKEFDSTTHDISAGGVRFHLDNAPESGAPIEFTLTLPEEITLSQPIRVRCKGRVVRGPGPGADQKKLVAAVIDDYEFVPEVENGPRT